MAADKLVDSAKLDSALTATADAIRAKTGSADKIVWNSETGFASVIEAITGGGSSDEWEILMPATDVTFDGGEYISFESVYPLELGKTYRVIWNGEEFICETEQITFNGMPCIAVGNTGMLTGEAGEHPFLIGYIPDASGFGIFTTDMTSDTHNVAIYKEKAAIIEGAHVVTFMSDDGATVLGEKPVMNGDTCGDPITLGLFSTPTKESTAQYEYTFNGWATTAGGAADANALVNITEDKTVYAAFKKDTRAYTIRFLDGDTVLQTMICEYGTTPSYTPVKDGAVFGGWSPQLVAVTENADYYATWVEYLDAGTCGDNAFWKLSADGVFTVYGMGDMTDYAFENAPWQKHESVLTEVVIEDGITNVGAYAFYQIANIKKATLGKDIVAIKNSAFYNCTSLEQINIPNGVKTIAESALGRTIISNIILPDTLETIGASAFVKINISEVKIPDSVTTVGNAAFSQCASLTSVELSKGMSVIPQAIFNVCSALKTITIPSNIVKIGPFAFSAVTSATFENTNGWWYADSADATSGTSIPSADLANPTTAATHLATTYNKKWWHRS